MFFALFASQPPIIDGRLSDEAWSHAPVADHFPQRDPDEGQPATERTEIRVLYDDDALYVGARLYDSEPAAISTRLSGRDDWPDADNITVFLDPRHDHRTGVQFTVTAAGVQRDGVISNDTFTDDSWDAVWSSAVSHDARGMVGRAAHSVLAAALQCGERQTWGINVSRFIRRKNETVWLEFWPKNDNGLASRMMHLAGLDGVRPRRRLELAPYTAVRQEFVEAKDGDPFNDGSRTFGSIGLDVKASVPGGLVLDATINPDFGQAEVDPAVVNLTAYETFFQEKRRFFIEGAEIFNNFGRGRVEQLLRLQQFQSEPLLLAPHRARAVGERRRRLRRRAARDDHPRRGKADRQDLQRVEHRRHRGGDGSRARAPRDGIGARSHAGRADDQLLRRAPPARLHARRRRVPHHVGAPQSRTPPC